MFCSNCGERLVTSNQKFCHNCGTKVLTTSKETDYRTERIQNVSAPKIYYVPVKQQTQLQRGRPGIHSKLCLWLGLSSTIIGIVSLIIGYNYFRLIYSPFSLNIGRLVVSIGILLFRVGGLILGVFSRINSSKAVTLEPYNDIEKAGSIFGTFGIIINSIGLALSFLGPWAIFRFPIAID